MTLTVVKGLVATPVRHSPSEAGSAPAAQAAPAQTTQSQTKPTQHDAARSVEGVISAAQSATVATEAVVTTIRATQKSAAFKEIRSTEDAEKIARKIAKEIDGGERDAEALAAHSGLDAVGRSGKNGLLL